MLLARVLDLSRKVGFMLLLLFAFVSSAAFARGVTVCVDGEVISLDVAPAMRHGWIFVPLRGIFEKMGALVVFNPATRKVFARKGGRTVELKVGEPKAKINGRAYLMIVPAIELSGRTLVPLRFVSEALGASVNWNSSSATVFVNTTGTQAIPEIKEIEVENLDSDSKDDSEKSP